MGVEELSPSQNRPWPPGNYPESMTLPSLDQIHAGIILTGGNVDRELCVAVLTAAFQTGAFQNHPFQSGAFQSARPA
jgi:hypothetical protein